MRGNPELNIEFPKSAITDDEKLLVSLELLKLRIRWLVANSWKIDNDIPDEDAPLVVGVLLELPTMKSKLLPV